MKNVFFTIAILTCVVAHTYGQVMFGARVGKSPNVTPGTNHVFVNRQDVVNESVFNIEQVSYSEQYGLMARLDRGRFWFMSEVMYGHSTAHYSMVYTRELREGLAPTIMNEKRSFLELPLSAGVALGVFEVFSGFSVAHDFGFKNELKQLEGYSVSTKALRAGWHTGIGLHYGPVLIDLRYQQQFGNYGQGQYINGQELILKNAPGRLLVTVGFHI